MSYSSEEPIKIVKEMLLTILNELQSKRKEVEDIINVRIEATKTLYVKESILKAENTDIDVFANKVSEEILNFFRNQLYLDFIKVVLERTKEVLYKIIKDHDIIEGELIDKITNYEKNLTEKSMNNELQKITAKNNELSLIISGLEKQILEKETDFIELKQLITDYDNKISDLEKDILKEKKAKDDTFNINQAQKDEIKELKKEISDLKGLISNLEKELIEKKDIEVQKLKIIKEKESEIEDYSFKQGILLAQIASLEAVVESLEKEVDELRSSPSRDDKIAVENLETLYNIIEKDMKRLFELIGNYEKKGSLSEEEITQLESYLEEYRLKQSILQRFVTLFQELSSLSFDHKLLSLVSPDGRYVRVNDKLGIKLRFQDIVNSFLSENMELEEYAMEYVKQLIFESTSNFPVYFFIRKTDLGIDEVINELNGIITPFPRSKKILIRRLKQKKTTYSIGKLTKKSKQGKIRVKFYEDIKNKQIPDLEALRKEKTMSYFLEAISHLKREEIIPVKQELFSILKEIFNEDYLKDPDFPKEKFRNALNNLDAELYFSQIPQKSK